MTNEPTAAEPAHAKLDYEAPRASISAVAAPLIRAAAALILVIVLGAIFNADKAFFKISTHRDLLQQASVYGILACGMTIVIISGGIDLAVGSVVALSAVCFAKFSIHWGWSPLICIPATLAIGTLTGIVSGTLIARFRIQPFIATLAMMVFARGLAKIVSGGMKVSPYFQDAKGQFVNVPLPSVFGMIDRHILGDNISVISVIFLACIAIAWIMLARHRWGRQLYAIGGNEEAARLSGVPVQMAKILAYASCGLLAAVAAICQAAQETQGDPEAGIGYELTAIAMVVVGGTALTGGRGGVGLTLLGVLTIGYLDKILSINAVPEAWRLMLTGVIIVVAVLAQGRRRT